MKPTHVLLFLALSIMACKSPTKPKTPVTETSTKTVETNTLNDLLTLKKERFLAKADSSKITDYNNGLKAVEASGILESALNVGDTAANFQLPNQNGELVSLRSLYQKQPIILTWYRGGWCPYCNITLSFLQDKLPDFEAAGAKLVALTPELPDSSMTTVEKNQLTFDILSDVGNVVAKDYGLVFQLTPKVAERYQTGFNLHAYNGNNSNELPLAATYIIDTNGVIQYAFLDADYRNRAEPDELLQVLGSL